MKRELENTSFEELIKMAHSDQVPERLNAVQELYFREETPELVELLATISQTDPDQEVRAYATGSLGGVCIASSVGHTASSRSPFVIAPLIETLKDPYDKVRITAIFCLKHFRDRNSVLPLLDIVASDKSEEVIRLAINTLIIFWSKYPVIEETFKMKIRQDDELQRFWSCLAIFSGYYYQYGTVFKDIEKLTQLSDQEKEYYLSPDKWHNKSLYEKLRKEMEENNY